MPVQSADDEVGELARTMDGRLEALDSERSARERAFDRQREFVADASHELRPPLTSVQANLELLQASLAGATEDDRHAVDSPSAPRAACRASSPTCCSWPAPTPAAAPPTPTSIW